MRFKVIKALMLFLALLQAQQAFAVLYLPCPKTTEEFLNALLNPESRWGWISRKKLNLKYGYDLRQSVPSRYLIPAQTQGLFKQDPQLIKMVHDLQTAVAPYSDFEAYFLKKFLRKPTASEILEYYHERSEILESAFEAFSWRVKSQNPKLAEELTQAWNKQLKGYQGNLAKAERGKIVATDWDFHHKQDIIGQGIFGELHASLALDHIDQTSMVLRSNSVIAERLQKISDSPKSIELLQQEYPHIFKRPSYSNDEMARLLNHESARTAYLNDLKGHPLLKDTDYKMIQKRLAEDPHSFNELSKQYKGIVNPSPIPINLVGQHLNQGDHFVQYITKAKNNILDKEIDFVLKNKSTTTWVEVKNPGHTITLEQFMGSEKHKSYYHQLLENQEILKYLGLDQKVKLQFYSTQGVDLRVTSQLKKMGIELLQ